MHTNSDFFCILSLELPYILTLASGFLAGISLKKKAKGSALYKRGK